MTISALVEESVKSLTGARHLVAAQPTAQPPVTGPQPDTLHLTGSPMTTSHRALLPTGVWVPPN